MSQAFPVTAVIAAEIRALRKGRGVSAGDLGRRLGPHLEELAGRPAASAVAGDLRQALAGELSDCAARLPPDLRTAVLVSLGLTAETRQMAHFGDRVWWLAERCGYTYRTGLRRIDAAEQLLAEQIAGDLRRRRGRTAAAPAGWYLDEFRAVLRLDTATPESHEHRRLVATRAGLSEVVAWLDVPRSPGKPRIGLCAEVAYGGRLVRREEPGSSSSRFQFVIELPVQLQPGDTHDYGLILRVPPGEQMRSHYLFTPECRCDTIDLRVRFHPGHLPVWVRQVEAETVRMFDDAQPGGESLSLDAAGEVHVRFQNPAMYLGYGLQWYP
jgi:hypothetical protein